MNHIKTMLCGNFIGIDNLERLKLLQSDPLVKECAISIQEPETVSRFLGNFSLMMLACNLFRLFKIDMVRTTEHWQQIKTFRTKKIYT